MLITNGGPHSAETHAGATAWKILELIRIPEEPVAADNPDRASIEAGREAARQGKAVLEPLLVTLLTPEHQKLLDAERAALKAEGTSRLDRQRALSDAIDEAAVAASVNGLFAASVFAAHFALPATQAEVKRILDAEFERVVGEERGWFADEPVEGSAAKAHHDKFYRGVRRDKNDPAVKAFRARRLAGRVEAPAA
jgi:hypothetical protein